MHTRLRVYLFNLDLLDAPMWLSLIDELWNSNDQSCCFESLCHMNRLALYSPGTNGIALSLSRYLLLHINFITKHGKA